MSLFQNIIFLPSVDSTNLYALANLETIPSGTMIAAAAQSAGRGTRGRSWMSPDGVNIYASFVLKDLKIMPGQASWIASMASLDLLKEEAPELQLFVKWPNDILCGSKKIAGILCEARGRDMVLGMGININMTNDDLLLLPKPGTSLLAETGIRRPDIHAMVIRLHEKAVKRYEQVCSCGIESLYMDWRKANYLSGRRVKVRHPDGRLIDGTVMDFTTDGALVLTDSSTQEVLTLFSCDILEF